MPPTYPPPDVGCLGRQRTLTPLIAAVAGVEEEEEEETQERVEMIQR